MKLALPDSVRQSIVLAQPRAALAEVADDDNPLLTRADRLRWLREFAAGHMKFSKYVRGMIQQLPADAPLRLRAVEVLARIEGDLVNDPFSGATIERMVLILPSNGRERMIVEAPEIEEPDVET